MHNLPFFVSANLMPILVGARPFKIAYKYICPSNLKISTFFFNSLSLSLNNGHSFYVICVIWILKDQNIWFKFKEMFILTKDNQNHIISLYFRIKRHTHNHIANNIKL